MKTIQELYNEVLKDEELKKAFAQAVQDKAVEGFLKDHGCGASGEELAAFLKEQQSKTGELSDNELDNVAGGCNRDEALMSTYSLGIGCTLVGISSAIDDKGKEMQDGRLLCSKTQYSGL